MNHLNKIGDKYLLEFFKIQDENNEFVNFKKLEFRSIFLISLVKKILILEKMI